MSVQQIADHKQRQEALSPHNSYIVQAPAGSGKTSLLTQRYLVLLSQVDAPEEIIAITFTRKAATEMRSRILGALQASQNNQVGSSEHEMTTHQLAQAALKRDTQFSWQLLKNPNRLRIQTIDAFCASLTRQMPILSRFGAQPEITEDAQALYLQAARNLLAQLETDVRWSEQIATLLQYLDNNLSQIEQMLINMLSRREQWLDYIIGAKQIGNLRQHLEASLQYVVTENLHKLIESVPVDIKTNLLSLAHFAADNVNENLIQHCRTLQALDSAKLDELPAWLGLAELLLTQSNTWRKSVSKTNGFPTPTAANHAEEKALYKTKKAAMKDLLLRLSEEEYFRQCLEELRACPPPSYNEQQWEIITALIELLPVLVAQLHLVFQQSNQVDFSEVSISALHALGELDAPSDLALKLDYQIKHLLVDEFQDTSISQYQLLEKIIAGWEGSDGRTLFLVGDPMQSIYRFRQAEVGLFLRARNEGLGAIPLRPLTLTVNFRSKPAIVNWINHSFTKLLPKHADIAVGAVPYTQAIAFHETDNTAAVSVHPHYENGSKSEASTVVELIKANQLQYANENIAVLVRARSHLYEITSALQQAGIHYTAVEIESLSEQSIVQDLLALTKALVHPADRIAWLAILRSPWCGLSLNDLHLLAHKDHELCLWDAINDESLISKLSQQGQTATFRLRTTLAIALKNKYHTSLKIWLQNTWIALGGANCLQDNSELDKAQAYFNLLDEIEEGGDITDFDLLEKKVIKLFANTQTNSNANIQIMTIHKSKGLEFDTVILPALERQAAHSNSQLMMWMERPRLHGGNDLLLAPIKSNQAQEDAIFSYLKKEENRKEHYELSRLLYVAATRTKKRLHLIGTVIVENNAIKPANNKSLLTQLWPIIAEKFYAHHKLQPEKIPVASTAHSATCPIQRLPIDWQSRLTIATQKNQFNTQQNERIKQKTYTQLSNESNQQLFGTIIHIVLQQICQQGYTQWQQTSPNTLLEYAQQLLLRHGMQKTQVLDSLPKIEKLLTALFSDKKAQWIFDNSHLDSQCEYALTAIINKEAQRFILDRTFIDDSGVRWIIDYKTGDHRQNKSAYEKQLQQYANIMATLDKRPIRLGLYYPLESVWYELKVEIPKNVTTKED